MKTKLLFLLLCASITFSGLAQNAISFTSAPLFTAEIGSTIQVDYQYTNDGATNRIACALELLNTWTYVSTVNFGALNPAAVGTNLTGSFFFTIPPGTVPTSGLVSPQNYKIKIRLLTSSGGYIAGAFPSTEIDLTAAPLGINDNKLLDVISVYPNPVDSVLNITNANALTNASFNIVNVLGETVIQSKGLNDTVDVSNLSSGVYILSVKSKEGVKNIKFQRK